MKRITSHLSFATPFVFAARCAPPSTFRNVRRLRHVVWALAFASSTLVGCDVVLSGPEDSRTRPPSGEGRDGGETSEPEPWEEDPDGWDPSDEGPSGQEAQLYAWGRQGVKALSLPGPTASDLYQVREALGSEGVVDAAAVSPDGSTMAIATRLTDPSSRASLWLLPLDGQQAPQLLYAHDVSIYISFEMLEWSPDGGWLVFRSNIPAASEPVGGRAFFAVSVETGTLRRVTPTVPAPADAPNGFDVFQSYAFSPSSGPTYVASLKDPGASNSPTGLWVTELRGTSVASMKRVLDTADLHPQWDDSGRVYTMSSDLGEARIVRVRADGTGTEVVPLTADRRGINGFAIAPDGRQLAFTESRELFVGDVDGTDVRQVASGSNIGKIVWSRNGQYLAFITSGSLAVAAVVGESPVTVLGDVDWRDAYMFSPDSGSLYVNRSGSFTHIPNLDQMVDPSTSYSLALSDSGLTYAGAVAHPPL